MTVQEAIQLYRAGQDPRAVALQRLQQKKTAK
jgi:hypothetical protein